MNQETLTQRSDGRTEIGQYDNTFQTSESKQ